MKEKREFNTIIDKYINKDRINHAYLIETNYDDRLSLAYELIKKIMNLDDSNMTIDSLYLNKDLYLISTELQTIKKEEIINLKNNYKTKSIYSGKRIYIIEEAEKLNNSSANTLLKFLEEPDDDIIAILITNNRYNVIETILSRCQIIRYIDKDNIKVELPDNSDKLIEFVKNIEQDKEKTIALENKFFTKDDFERKKFQDNLTQLLYIYYDILQKKVNLDVVYYKEYEEDIEKISKEINYNELNLRIKSINDAINKLKYNTNTKLVLDSMIIESTGGVKNV